MIVQTALGITIIGAGRTRSKQITHSLRHAPVVIAADGGLNNALRHDLIPAAIIGDLDSVVKTTKIIPKDRFHRIEEQDSTDFEKCLYSIHAPFVIAHGVTGSRLDHSLAALNALAKYDSLRVVILSGKDLVFLCPATLDIDLPVGTRLSLVPLAKVSGQASGLEHPIGGIVFDPLGRIGTSNRTVTPKVSLRFDAARMLVILPWKQLPSVLSAFSRMPD